jgi:phosphate/sulfate permease
MGILFWIIGSIIAAFLGMNKRIGFFGALFISLILSPLIGLIVAAMSKDIDEIGRQNTMINAQKKQNEALKAIQENTAPKVSASDELEKIVKLKESGIISDEEYQKLKDKIINN